MMFKEILQKAWYEYNSNFDAIFKLMLVLNLIPNILFSILLNLPNWSTATFFIKLSLSIPAFLIFAASSFYLLTTIFKTPLYKSHYKFKDFFNLRAREYFYFIGFFIVSSLFLLGLFLLLIIPGIIFFIYWILSPYIFFKEKKGILGSLERSRVLVKGKWWKVFRHTFLISIIFIPIYIILIPYYLTEIIFAALSPDSVSISLYTMRIILSVITNFTNNLITYPIVILFYKHLYIALKKAKK